MNEGQFYVVYLWMHRLGLSMTELHVYAIVYGFSKSGRGELTASQTKLSDWLGCSRRSANAALQSLVEKGLLVKRTAKATRRPHGYRAVRPQSAELAQPSPAGSNKMTPPWESISQVGVSKWQGSWEDTAHDVRSDCPTTWEMPAHNNKNNKLCKISDNTMEDFYMSAPTEDPLWREEHRQNFDPVY